MTRTVQDLAALMTSVAESFGKIERMDPAGPAYAKLRAFLDARTLDELEMLEAAGIKWVSSLARNRVWSRKRETAADFDRDDREQVRAERNFGC